MSDDQIDPRVFEEPPPVLPNRRAFFQRLSETIDTVERFKKMDPAPAAAEFWDQFLVQLTTMKKWASAEEGPSEHQKELVNVGWLALREFEEDPSPRMQKLKDDIVAVDEYFRVWPEG
ncbi:MAG: hypothetical protein HOW73_22035 [Polyangiaceae bacterium]|nr:hypothetical protein [Polyangiaceae bacterium]